MSDLGLTTASTQVFSNLVNDLYGYLKGKIKTQITKQSIENKLPEMMDKINSIRLVKTLWQVDKAVDLETFYCESNIIFHGVTEEKQTRRTVNITEDFGIKRNIVILGIAGQGKSIFLKHLCIKEFEAGKRIPVFIELRRIQENETLLEHISRFLDILNLEIDSASFKIFAKSGKFVFFLDGFDEIPDERKTKIINELEYLASVSSDCQFIVTSRPNASIDMSTIFDVVTLDNLRNNEYKSVIRKLADTTEYANTLIRSVKSNRANIAELLCTPLLVTMLILSYKSFQKIPDQLSDFYESIFYVLIRRHDGSKPGFIRRRGCLLSDTDYREIFDALCFESHKLKGTIISYPVILEQVKNAMKLSNMHENPENYLKDIINITCLILEEGNEYRYIHNTVREYYAASFIKNRPEILAQRYYDKCLNDIRAASHWRQELVYLSGIDKYRYDKFYLMPLLEKWMDCSELEILLSGPPPNNISRMRNLFKCFDLTFIVKEIDSSEKEGDLVPISSAYQTISPMEYYRNYFSSIEEYKFNYKRLYDKFYKEHLIIDTKLLSSPEENIDIRPNISLSSINKITISVQQLIDEGVAITELELFSNKIISFIHSKWKSAYDYVNSQDTINIEDLVS